MTRAICTWCGDQLPEDVRGFAGFVVCSWSCLSHQAEANVRAQEKPDGPRYEAARFQQPAATDWWGLKDPNTGDWLTDEGSVVRFRGQGAAEREAERRNWVLANPGQERYQVVGVTQAGTPDRWRVFDAQEGRYINGEKGGPLDHATPAEARKTAWLLKAADAEEMALKMLGHGALAVGGAYRDRTPVKAVNPDVFLSTIRVRFDIPEGAGNRECDAALKALEARKILEWIRWVVTEQARGTALEGFPVKIEYVLS